MYVWDKHAVERMAGESCIALAAAWRNLVLYSVGAAFSATCGDVSAQRTPEPCCVPLVERVMLVLNMPGQCLKLRACPCFDSTIMSEGCVAVPDLCILWSVGGTRLL